MRKDADKGSGVQIWGQGHTLPRGFWKRPFWWPDATTAIRPDLPTHSLPIRAFIKVPHRRFLLITTPLIIAAHNTAKGLPTYIANSLTSP